MAISILCSLIPTEVRTIHKHFDVLHLTSDEVLSELVVARIAFLEAGPEQRYLLLPQVSPLGLFASLPQHISVAKQAGTSRLTCMNQLYDLELKNIGGRCQLHDCLKQRAIEFDWRQFSSSVFDAAQETWQQMLLAFPGLSDRADADNLRIAIGLSKRRS